MMKDIQIYSPLVLPQAVKLFVCTNNPSKSFSIDFKDEELSSLNLKQLLQQAQTYFQSLSDNAHFGIENNSLRSFYAKEQFYESQNQLLLYTQFNIMPIYFEEKKVLFDIKVSFQNKLSIQTLPINFYTGELISKLSQKYELQQNKLYLLHNNDILYKNLSEYEEVELNVATDYIFIDDQQFFVKLDFTVYQNYKLFNYSFNSTNLYFNGQTIENQKSFQEQGINNESKLTTYILIDAFMKDIKTKIKNNFIESEVENQYKQYFPAESGIFKYDIKEGVYYFRKEEINYNIQVASLSGKVFYSDIDFSCTVKNLKEQIQKIEGIPNDQQRLIYNGKQLEEERKLSDYNMQKRNIVHLVLNLRGGSDARQTKLFVDVENIKQKQQLNFSIFAPEYRVAGEGINIEGYCQNEKCQFFNQLVISRIGFGSIEIVQDIQNQIKCPNYSCNSSIKLETCGFVNCQYSWSGLKVADERPKQVNSSLITAITGKYTRYNPIKEDGSSNKATWVQLFLFAKQPISSKYTCYICLKEIQSHQQITQSQACNNQHNHKCHLECQNNMKLFEGKCLLCLTFI